MYKGHNTAHQTKYKSVTHWYSEETAPITLTHFLKSNLTLIFQNQKIFTKKKKTLTQEGKNNDDNIDGMARRPAVDDEVGDGFDKNDKRSNHSSQKELYG